MTSDDNSKPSLSSILANTDSVIEQALSDTSAAIEQAPYSPPPQNTQLEKSVEAALNGSLAPYSVQSDNLHAEMYNRGQSLQIQINEYAAEIEDIRNKADSAVAAVQVRMDDAIRAIQAIGMLIQTLDPNTPVQQQQVVQPPKSKR